jgi:hypothetical protein
MAATKKAAAKNTGRNVPSKKGVFDDMVETGTGNDETNVEVYTPKSAMASYSDQASIDTSDVFIPKLRLAQGLTTEVTNGTAKIGDWLISGEDPMKKPVIVPVLMNKRRELRDPDENRQVICRSTDSFTGVGDPGGNCATCPMSKWTESKKKNGKNVAPACTFIYSYVVYVVDLDKVVILEFSRTSIPAGKMLNTMILQKGFGNFAAQLSATTQKNNSGTFSSPVINGMKSTDKILKAAKERVAEMFGSA